MKETCIIFFMTLLVAFSKSLTIFIEVSDMYIGSCIQREGFPGC